MFTLSRRATLLLLLTAAAAQQVRYVAGSVLPAQDVVDTVSVAQRIENEGLPATARTEPVPPLFPALVAGTHLLLSNCGVIDGRNWISPPQWIAAAALIGAVIPIFLTAERMAGRGAAVMATIFFIALPAVARLGADGLGDAVHLFIAAWSTWLILNSRWAMAGLGVAAALLVRAEAAVVPLTIFLLAVRRPTFRIPRFFAAAGCCVLPFLAFGVTSPGEIVSRLRGGAAPTENVPLNGLPLPSPYWLMDGRDVNYFPPSMMPQVVDGASLTFGHKDRTRSTRFHGFAATIREYYDELFMAGGYVLPLLVVAGMWTRFRCGWSEYDLFASVAVGLHLAAVFGMAWKNGYLSTRHFVLPVVFTLPYAVIGAQVSCRRIQDALVTASRAFVRRAARQEPSPLVYFEIGLITTFVLVSLVATSQPLHASVLAHRRAAEWLQTATPGRVLDQFGYTALTSGRTTYRFDAAETALADHELSFVLVERADLEANSPRGRSLRTVLGLADSAEKVFAAPHGRTERDVLIFRRPLGNFAFGGNHHAR